jgi:hypothetical protein
MKTHLNASLAKKYLGSQHFPTEIKEFTFEILKGQRETVELFNKKLKKLENKQMKVIYFKDPPEWANLPWLCNELNSKKIGNLSGVSFLEDLTGIMLTLEQKNVEQWMDNVTYDESGTEARSQVWKVGPALRVKNAVSPDPNKAREELREVLNKYLPKFKSASIEDFELKVDKIENFDFQTATKHLNTYTNLLTEAEKSNKKKVIINL